LTFRVYCDIIYLPLKVFFFVKTFFPSEKVLFCVQKPLRMREAKLFFGQEQKTKIFRKTGGAVMRVKITLACTECKQRNYNTMKNKKNDPDRLEMNKYCRFCKKHTVHKETK